LAGTTLTEAGDFMEALLGGILRLGVVEKRT